VLFFLSSGQDGVRIVMLQGIIELGELATRNFFEHRMSTYAAALAYRGLFGLFPFVLILLVLAGALGLSAFVDRMDEQATSRSPREVPQQLEPVVEQGREQIQPLERLISRPKNRPEESCSSSESPSRCGLPPRSRAP